MSSRGETATAVHAYPARRKRSNWLRRAVLALFVIGVVLPFGLTATYRFVDPPGTPLMLFYGGPVTQSWVPLTRISPNLVHAVIASEDTKFCSHSGFDFDAIDEAMDENAAGGRLRGASTISQQTAKNLFLLPDRSWARKGVEAYFTALMEFLWPKRRIIEIYLNVAEMGPGLFGAEAAARANFHKAAAELGPSEAARLAAILPSPRTYRAEPPGPYVERQSQTILARMAQVRRDKLDGCVNQ